MLMFEMLFSGSAQIDRGENSTVFLSTYNLI